MGSRYKWKKGKNEKRIFGSRARSMKMVSTGISCEVMAMSPSPDTVCKKPASCRMRVRTAFLAFGLETLSRYSHPGFDRLPTSGAALGCIGESQRNRLLRFAHDVLTRPRADGAESKTASDANAHRFPHRGTGSRSRSFFKRYLVTGEMSS